jgi:hypothetical protein
MMIDRADTDGAAGASDTDKAASGEVSGERESIEPSPCGTFKFANLQLLRAMSPAGIEPTFKV